MQHRLIAAARKLNTSENWNRLAIVLSVLVIAFAMAVLVHQLRDVSPSRVYTAFKAIPTHNIVIACLLVAAAYVTLTFYDWFALRTIGKTHVPYRMAAFAAFSSYSIGHNIGATVFTGNAIRFRLYASYGLTIIDIAKLAFVTGLTFWLGNAVVLGLGISYEPEAASAINQLPVWLNRALAIFVLTVIAAYLFWVGRKTAHRRTRQLAGHVARRAAHARSDRHRHSRSRFECAGHVHAAADECRKRFRRDPRHLHLSRPCSALRAMRPAALACSMRRCWSRCRNSTRRRCWPRCFCSG